MSFEHNKLQLQLFTRLHKQNILKIKIKITNLDDLALRGKREFNCEFVKRQKV